MTCLSNTVCEGGANVIINSGYWRSSNDSTAIHKCLNKNACPYVFRTNRFRGGIGTSTNGTTPCAKGYGGNLCDKCVHDEEGNTFERVSAHACSQCPSLTVNVLRILGLTIIVLLYVAINIRYEC